MGRHSSGTARRWRLPALLALLATVVVLAVATRWYADPTASAQSRPSTRPTTTGTSASTDATAGDPCADGFGEQQQTGTARPDAEDVRGTDFAPEPRVGLVDRGLCLDWSYELSTPGWSLTRVQVVAHQKGVDLSSSLAADREGTALFVPLTGCVRATWIFSLSGPGGVAGTWTARSVHGQDCPRYRGGS